MTHSMKCLPESFDAIAAGRKTFTVRRDDRQPPYVVGDIVELREWDDRTDTFTGFAVERQVTYILEGGRSGVEEGFVVLALAPTGDEVDDVLHHRLPATVGRP